MDRNLISDNAYLAALCIGLDIYKAKNRILHAFPHLSLQDIDITYRETEDIARYTVLACVYDEKKHLIRMDVSSTNAIRHLPSNYQNNDFVRNFLMIFQHIFNDTAITLDNMHNLFRPMECPSHFLSTLADWFGIHLDTLGGEDEVRHFLQYAIPLFRLRGTALGLRMYLAIVSGIKPDILEGELPYTALEINDNAVIDVSIFESIAESEYFTVHFPVLREQLSESLIRRLSLIVQQEKPVHTKCFISFKEPEIEQRPITTISSETTLSDEGGISL